MVHPLRLYYLRGNCAAEFRKVPVVNVNSIFGFNLRLLCGLRPSIAEATRELDLSKGQMARFLNGTATPKPAVLKKICDIFGVDARILLEELTPAQIEMLKVGKPLEVSAPLHGISPSTLDGARYIFRDRDLFKAENNIKDGFYLNWRWSHSRLGAIIKVPLLVKTVGSAKVVKGWDDYRLIRAAYGRVPPIENREFRGVVQGSRTSLLMIFRHGLPMESMSMIFGYGVSLYNEFQVDGISVSNFPERSDGGRISRCVTEYLPNGFKETLGHMRNRCFHEPEDVDKSIMSILNKPLA